MSDDTFFRQRTVLVTGASGFVGTHLCQRLKNLGAEVHGVSRSLRNNRAVSKWWQAELSNEIVTRKLIQSIAPDIIFHLASLVSGKREMKYVLPTLQCNLLSTINLLIGATEYGCQKLILTGSLEEMEGDVAAATPASPYAAAKGAASAYARMFYTLYSTSVVTARLFMVYGPNQKDHAKLVPYVTLSLLRGQLPELMSGTREIDWIYVDDVIDAYLCLAMKEGIDGETIDVGSGGLTSVRRVVDSLVELINPDMRLHFGKLQDRPFERTRVADVDHAYKLSGWKPKTRLSDGLKQTVDWYRNNMTDNS